jgi:hypothetical protein
MILSARAESIILSAPPAESMILSALPEWQWATLAAQRAAGRKAIALGNGISLKNQEALFHVHGIEHLFSITLSAGSAESMILSVHAESIILSAQPAESMILSQRCPHASVPWNSAHERALMLRASYSQRAALRV